MATFKKAYAKMITAEYSGKESLFIHHLSDEQGYTAGGIYQKANPKALNWELIDLVVKFEGNIKAASVVLFKSDALQKQIFTYFKRHYWDTARLDEIQSQHIAEEIYIASVLYSPKKAIKMAQKLAKVLDDGVLGQYSLKGINLLDENVFDEEYDKLEIKLAESIAEKYHKHHYLNGWKARAVFV